MLQRLASQTFAAGLLGAMVAFLALAWPATARQPQGQPDRPKTWEVRVPPKPSPPSLTIEPATFEAGDMKPSEKRTASFRLTNTSDSTLELEDVRSTCWCAAGEVKDRSLEPGESVTMEATLEAPPEPGLLERAIYIYGKGYAQPAILTLRADVNYGIRTRIEFDSEEQTRLGIVHLESADGKAFRVISANFASPVFVDGFDPAHDAPRAVYTIRYDLSAAPPGMLPPWFLVETDHPDSPVIDLAVVPEGEEVRRLRPWILSTGRVMLGQFHPGGWRDFVVTLRGVREDPLNSIESLETEPGAARVALMGVEPSSDGTRARFRVSAEPTERGVVFEKLTIQVNGHDEWVYIMGRVAPTGE